MLSFRTLFINKFSYLKRFIAYFSKSKLEIVVFLSFMTYLIIIYSLFSVGIVYLIRQKKYQILIFCLTFMVIYLPIVGFYGKDKYKIPIMPLLLMISAHGAVVVENFISKRRKSNHVTEEKQEIRV